MGWCATAQKQRVQRGWPRRGLIEQFSMKRLQVLVDQVVTTSNQGKVTITTAMCAEGNMNVGCAWLDAR